MRNFHSIILGAALGLTAGAAFGADMPTKAPGPVPYVSSVYNWSGIYVGGNVGYGESKDSIGIAPGNANAKFLTDAGVIPGSLNPGGRGIVGGLQVGYNYQLPNNIVLGIEGDISGTDIKGSQSARFSTVPLGFPATLTTTASNDLKYLATFSGRAGYAFDRLLVFGKGGIAFGQVDQTTNVSLVSTIPALNGSAIGKSSELRVGYVAGVGAEYAVNDRWSVKAEAVYFDLGDKSVAYGTTVAGAPFALNSNGKLSGAKTTIGANFHF